MNNFKLCCDCRHFNGYYKICNASNVPQIVSSYTSCAKYEKQLPFKMRTNTNKEQSK